MFATQNAGHKYIDRGLLLAYDYGLTDFIIDNAWHVKDLSGIIGKGEKLLFVTLGVANDSIARAMCLRTAGQEDTKNFGGVMSFTDGYFNEHLVTVFTDADGKIDYHCESSGCTWTLIQFVIRGYIE